MNILHFLKSTAGAVSKAGLASVAVTGGLVALHVYHYVQDTPQAREQEVRSLASALSSGQVPAEYQQYMTDRGGIRIANGNVEFANAEERAAHENSLFDVTGGESAVQSLDGIGNITGRSLGSGENGLGMGANAVDMSAARAAASYHGAAPDGSAVAAAAAQKAADAASGPQLKSASVTTASGSNLGSGSGSFGSGMTKSATNGPSGGLKNVADERAGRVGPGSISGSMGQGSTRLASVPERLRGATSSSFRPGNVHSRGGRSRSREAANGLKQIAVESAEIADRANKNGVSTNEGAVPFMAGRKRGLMTVDDNPFTTSTAVGVPDDMGTKGLSNMENKLDKGLDDIDDKVDNWATDHENLWLWLMGIVGVTMLANLGIAALAKIPVVGSTLKLIAAGIMVAALTTAFFKVVRPYTKNYGWDVLSGLTTAAIAFMTYTVIKTAATSKATAGAEEKAVEQAAKASLGKKILVSTAVGVAVQGTRMAVDHVDNKIHQHREENKDK